MLPEEILQRNVNNIPLVSVNSNYFMNIFPSTITEWNKLGLSIRNSTSLNIFKGRLLQFVRSVENSVFSSHNPIGIKYHCPNFSTARNTFLNEIAILVRSINDQNKIRIIQTFLYGNPTYSVHDNKLILDGSIKYILETKIFDGPIF